VTDLLECSHEVRRRGIVFERIFPNAAVAGNVEYMIECYELKCNDITVDYVKAVELIAGWCTVLRA
jgi:ABC-type molybdate transport system ATPase subunit